MNTNISLSEEHLFCTTLLLLDKNVFSTFCMCTLVGGNDNGSRGVAMLEVARQLSEKKKKGTKGGKYNFICCN